ncbi:hypothetical protein CREGCYN_13600 [Synechococcus sp. M16CYN]
MGQVTTGAKYHQTLWRDNAFLAKSNPKRIGDRGDHRTQASEKGLDAKEQMHTV